MKKYLILFVLATAGIAYGFINPPQQAKSTAPAVGIEMGNTAPEIALNDTSGKPLSLKSLRGKVVLIDFWASWCGPCRMENPNVVNVYNKYKNMKLGNAKGFTVYSVSLDRAKAPWVQAIKQDGLTWPYHVSDLQWWSSAAGQRYGVSSIPTNWLIDEKGVIIGRGLRGEALEQELAGLLANQTDKK